jgi:hypothetical protein
MKTLTVLFLTVLISFTASAQLFTLFENGKTDLPIRIQSNPMDFERRAADTLKFYLDKISGADFKIISQGAIRPKEISVIGKLPSGIPQPFVADAAEEESYSIFVNEKRISITGREKGIFYAVYRFLEKYFNCRLYAPGALVIPKINKAIIKEEYEEQHTRQSLFRINYYGPAFDPLYAQWHGLSNEPKKNGLNSNSKWGLWVHTTFKLVPPQVYFDAHSEYYSLRNGVRTKDQLCLSNTDVLKITIDSLRAQISRNPVAKFWSVSQMDNYNFCECADCKRTDSLNGSQAGTVIEFTNKVAAAFPDKVISTLAYQYSRKAPLKVRPANNVNIMLCTIECDRSKPIETDKSKGSFYDDLKNWSALTKNIIVWDYVINFSNLCSPFPNLHVLKPNLQLFKKFGVYMHFQQGLSSYGGEMEELRAYLISKLLWNMDINIDSVKDDFLNGYYQAAAPNIKRILDTMELVLKKSGKPLLIYEHPFAHRDDYLSPELIKFYHEQLAIAFIQTYQDSKILKRVDKFAQGFRYADIEVAKAMINTDHWIFEKDKDKKLVLKNYYDSLLSEFTGKCKTFGPPVLHETSLPPDEYETKTRNYFNTAIEDHLAAGAKLSFATPYNQQYKANGPQSLVDGIHGYEKWEALWQGWWGKDIVATIDLGKAKEIHLVKMNFMDDNQSWILAPASMKVEISTDGKIFTEAGKTTNPNEGTKLEKQIVPLEVNLTKPAQARFIKVIVKNIGKLPAWRGVNGDAWVFTDEIVVK